MKLKGRGLYNLLRLNAKIDKKLSVKAWQIADYRSYSLNDLLNGLKKLGIVLDEKSFMLYADQVFSPEELIDLLWDREEDILGYEKAYLFLFELWRRLRTGPPPISVFCDELDHLIERYDHKQLDDINALLNHLTKLEGILDDFVDVGGEIATALPSISAYCAHDVEKFLYDFILDLLLSKEDLTASELVDGFYEYVEDKRWFDLLRAELMYPADPEEARLMLRRLREGLKEESDKELLFDLLPIANRFQDTALFVSVFLQLFCEITFEEELHELLMLLSHLLKYEDRDEEAKNIDLLIEQRASLDPDNPISDKALLQDQLEPILEDLNGDKV